MFDEIEEYDEFIAFLSPLLRAEPANAILLNNRGLAYAESGRRREAFADLRAATLFAEAGNHIPENNLSDLQESLRTAEMMQEDEAES